MSGPGASVTLVVVAYNSAEALRWQAGARPGAPVLVVDNASADDTQAAAREAGAEVLALPENIGFGAAAMAGLARVETPFALILNPDARVEAPALAALEAAAARYPEADILLPRLLGEDGAEFFRFETAFDARAPRRVPPEGEACVTALSGAAVFVRVADFLARGGFDPEIFLFFEDDDLALRRRAARQPLIYVPSAEVAHLSDRSSGGSARAARIKHLSFGWSLVHVARKHGRGGVGRRMALMAAKLPVYLVSGRWSRLRRQTLRLRGMVRALRGRPAPFRPASGG